jgi:hypothetical protein
MKSSLAWVALSVLVLAACGGSTGDDGGGGDGGGGAGGGPQACAEHPLDCPDGQTCWFAAGGTFACAPSGAGKLGETCSPLVGQPTCGDDLLCVKKTGAEEGACVTLCDTTLGEQCGDLLCVPVELESGEQTHVCL